MNTRAFMCLAAVVLLAFAHSALAREHSGTLLAPTGTDGRPLADPLASTRSMPDWNTVRDDLAVTTDGRLSELKDLAANVKHTDVNLALEELRGQSSRSFLRSQPARV
ncbi:hypothetical protein MNEG_4459 [Monoraphidium neglectum]|uniref:Uncharacterized protein n=1 Tax=Monoraphidium neglectum TaxID=145388 RepID=A0A0D2MST7_9CHLO|nr:hypothetical protein MNEG_4459 [Monoraphidium neglectum]KIZ03497.1 hypothetical protein MNEG_4459 [Monoraphidium neglectum]|eukprot:XP_013902516.1 hypothetical protein MNEG_4459 [Monoraphidium neglectum]